MKKIILTFLIIINTICLYAQSADEFFKTVLDKTKSYDDISIIFNYKMINEEAGINESMNGYGSIKGDSYKINVNGQELISDGKTLWTHLIDDEEVMISEVTEDSNSTPLALIESFSENVTIGFIQNNDPEIRAIEIKENEGDTFDKIEISVNAKDLKIKKVHAYLTDGNEFIYEITDFKTNQNLPDNMFIFDEAMHPNVEVIDMR